MFSIRYKIKTYLRGEGEFEHIKEINNLKDINECEKYIKELPKIGETIIKGVHNEREEMLLKIEILRKNNLIKEIKPKLERD